MMEITNLLHNELEDGFKNLEGMEEGTDPYKSTVDSLTKLTDRAIEIQKLEDNYSETCASREFEQQLKREQFEFEKDLKLKQFEFEKDLKLKQFEAEQRERETERTYKLQQVSEDTKHRWIDKGLRIAEIVIPVGIAVWGTKKSFEFEKEGTITTIMGRGFIQKLLPKK